MPLTWAPDPDPAKTGDPYSDWSSGYGRDFAVRNRLYRENPDDFQRQADVTCPKPDGPNFPAEIAVVPPGQGPEPVQPGDPKKRVVRYPLPLRNRCFPAGSGTAAEWDIPDDLEAGDFGSTVVVAVIDDGNNFAHERFRLPGDRSRVDFAWVQDGAWRGGDVPFGAEWRRPEIEAAIAASGGVHERLMADLGLVDFSRPGEGSLSRRVSHGTHMMDVAAGMPPGADGARRTRIISVQVPFLMTQDSSGTTYVPFVVAAVNYVLERVRLMSEKLGTALPVVINFSYAIAGGPHDGQQPMERHFDAAIRRHENTPTPSGLDFKDKTALVLPAGNRLLLRGHAIKPSPGGGGLTRLDLPWRLQPGDQTSSYLETWLPVSAVNPEIRIAPPGGSAVTFSLADGLEQVLTSGDDVVGRLTVDLGAEDRLRVVFAVAPSEINWVPRSPIHSGVWKIRVQATLAEDEKIETWAQRDESPYRYRGNARETWIEDKKYQRFEPSGRPKETDNPGAVVRRDGSLSGIATGRRAYVVGGYIGRSAKPSRYSSAGSIRKEDPQPIKGPDLMAVADRSAVLPGVLAAGTTNNSVAAITGTSVAAPQITRDLADRVIAAGGVANAWQEVVDSAEIHESGLVDPPHIRRQRKGAGRARFIQAEHQRQE